MHTTLHVIIYQILVVDIGMVLLQTLLDLKVFSELSKPVPDVQWPGYKTEEFEKQWHTAEKQTKRGK